MSSITEKTESHKRFGLLLLLIKCWVHCIEVLAVQFILHLAQCFTEPNTIERGRRANYMCFLLYFSYLLTILGWS